MDPLTIALITTMGLGLADQFFGSGKKAADAAERTSQSQEELAQAQLAELERATGLRETLQHKIQNLLNYLGMDVSPEELQAMGVLPADFVDFSDIIGQDTNAIDMLSVAPGLTRGAMFDRLMGLAGTASGQGAIGNAAALAQQRDLVNQQQLNDTISNLVFTLLSNRPRNTAKTTPGTGDGDYLSNVSPVYDWKFM